MLAAVQTPLFWYFHPKCFPGGSGIVLSDIDLITIYPSDKRSRMQVFTESLYGHGNKHTLNNIVLWSR